MKRFAVVAGCVMAAGLVSGAAWLHAQAQAADVIFTNGRIVTLDSGGRVATGLAVAGDRIVVVGTAQQALARRGPNTRVVDLNGKTLIPGLQDSHIHFLSLGRDLVQRADFTFAKDARDMLRIVQELKDKLKPKPGEWLMGSRWDQAKYPSMATRWQLDEIAPENPVRLGRVYRGVLVNSAVFKLMGIDETKSSTWPEWWTTDPANFTFEDKIYREKRRVVVDGAPREMDVPTGVFLGRRGSSLVRVRAPSEGFDGEVESVKLGVKELLRYGITAIVEADSNKDHSMQVFQESYKRGEFLIRAPGVYFGSVYKQKPEEFAAILKPFNMHEPDNDFMRWKGVKFYADGGAGTRSAWVSEPFAKWQELEGKENHGEPEVEDYAAREAQYRAVADLGWDLHTHACGDLAMQETVKLYMKLMDEIHQKRPNADLRWSVIHAYLPNEPKTSVLADMAKYHILAVPNPVFNWQQGKGFVTNLGEERMGRTQPFRSYLKAGVRMPSGSDYPITTADPWASIYELLTRKDQATGLVHGAQETIGIIDALKSDLIDGAYLTYDDKERGTLEAGKLADLVMLDIPDIMQLEKSPELCFRMPEKVLMTMVGGAIRYQKGS